MVAVRGGLVIGLLALVVAGSGVAERPGGDREEVGERRRRVVRPNFEPDQRRGS